MWLIRNNVVAVFACEIPDIGSENNIIWEPCRVRHPIGAIKVVSVHSSKYGSYVGVRLHGGYV
jgi:hypothetical protein